MALLVEPGSGTPTRNRAARRDVERAGRYTEFCNSPPRTTLNALNECVWIR
jgi:hypothetical protein